MDTSTPQGMNSTHTNETPEGMFWSAAESARQCGVSRATIDRALKSGKLAAEKDEEGAWRISPHALAEAGLNPGKPSPPDMVVEDQAVGSVSREVHHLTVELERARAEARVQAARADALEEVVTVYRRQLDAPAPVEIDPVAASPVPPPESAPIQTPQADPARPAQANLGRFRRAWNVARHG